MARAETRRIQRSKPAPLVGPGPFQGLQFKLGLLFLLALVLLAVCAYLASRTLVQEKLLDENFRYEQESGLRLAADLRSELGEIELLAAALTNLAADPDWRMEQLRNAGPTLLKQQRIAGLVASIGIWPEPRQMPGVPERASLYWLHESGDVYHARDDYNDSRSAPYYRERWYTPARYVSPGHGYWTDRRQEPLLKREVLSYVMPIQHGGVFAGAVTISLDADALSQRFASLAGTQNGYALLLDSGQRLIGISSQSGALRLGMTAAELAKQEAAYSPLALELFKQQAANRAAMTRSSRYDARQVSALKDNTRDLSRQEADDLLSAIWATEQPAVSNPADHRHLIEKDSVLKAPAYATAFALQSPSWTLLRITAANQGFTGASYLFRQSLVVTLGLVTLTLLLAFMALRALVIRPLQQMIKQLAGSHNVDEAVNIVLDASARSEIGMLAHWHNERVRQLRDAIDNTRVAQSQLSNETHERRQLQEQLIRSQERAALALQSISDAVITTDARGLVDEMNLAAEMLTGMSQRESRGRVLTEILPLSSDEYGGKLPNLALQAMERGARIDYPSGVMLDTLTEGSCEIVLNGSPLHSGSRMIGAVLVFHPRRSSRNDGRSEVLTSTSRHQLDLLTGLPTRSHCEQQVTLLLEQSKITGLTHALLYLDVDHLKRINDSGGQSAGDDVLVRVAETLAQGLLGKKNIYRIAADQFVVVLDSVDESAARETAESLRAQLAATRFYWESRYFSVTASFGVVLLDRTIPSALESIRRADDACAAAKRSGRNTVQLYDARMDRVGRMIDDDTWVRCIKRGLSDDLFHLRTQWILAGKDYMGEGRVYEVLLALEDEEGFWAAPAAFMPVAERHHLTTAIDRWVIEQTLRHLKAHPALMDTLSFCCINLSTETLIDPSFLDFIAGSLEQNPEFAPKLCFELRELALTDQPREAALCCEVLHRMGCKVSVDSYFGRHISDLTLLRKLPIDFVKIDAQGFKNLGSDPIEQMLAESILRIVRHLRRRVIVNNIDDAGSMEVWNKLGADYLQGFALAKPSPVLFLSPD